MCGVLPDEGKGNTLHTSAILHIDLIPRNKVFITGTSFADSTGQYNPGNTGKFLLSVV